MSQGKYSPSLPNKDKKCFIYNCYGTLPAEYTGEDYNKKLMFADYDSQGFDCYGHSAFDKDGNYAFGCGVDRNGYTEYDYLCMDSEEIRRT